MTKEDLPLAHAGMASQFDLQKEYYEKGKIFILQIESTLKCPQLCKYCYANSKPDSPDGLSSKKIMEILDSAAKLDVKMIDWLGGDPLIRKDWYELCQYALDLGFINNMWTSGIPLADPDLSRKAVEISKDGFISTHLDTIDPKLYALLHGDKMCEADLNSINLIIKGIKNTLKWGKNPEAMVNCITYTSSIAEGGAKSMISYFQDNFGIKTCLTLFNPVIHRKADKEWEPSILQIKDAFAYRDEINYPEDPSCGPMDVSKFYCGTVVCITAEGWLTPCSVIRTTEFGNIKDKTLEKLVEEKRRSLLFLDFRDKSKLPGNCSKCANNSLCFGCRSSAYYYAGDILAADPKCYQFQSEE